MLRTITEVHGQKPVFSALTPPPRFRLPHRKQRTQGNTLHDSASGLPKLPGNHGSGRHSDPRKTYGIQRPGGLLYRTPFGLSKEEIEAGIHALQPVAGRNHLIETPALTILDDCYNANPASMKASLDVLSLACGHRTAVLGDMKELGENEDRLHFETGEYAARKGIDQIICIGPLAENMYQGAKNIASGNTVLYYPDKEQFLKELPSLFHAGDTILVKASNSMKLLKL